MAGFKERCTLIFYASWSKDLVYDTNYIFSNRTWETIARSSRNPNHQVIHWKLAHKNLPGPTILHEYFNLSKL